MSNAILASQATLTARSPSAIDLSTMDQSDPSASDSKQAWRWAFLLTPLAAWLAVCLSLGVFQRDLSIPFEYGHDAFLVTVPIKTMVEEGWWYESPHLGAPMKMEFYDYPSSPNLHIAILKLMSLVETNAFRLVNYYFLLSFPLIALCTLAAFKSYNLRLWPSVGLTLLFTLSPYHFWRGIAHLWLGCYFTVPLAMIIIAWVVLDRSGLLVDGERGAWRTRWFSRRSLVAVAICAALGFDFPYYPIFAAFLLMVVGPFTAYRLQSWRPLVRAIGLVGLIAAFFVVNLLPNIAYRIQHGKNMSSTLATIRHWSHAEVYGLKIAAMLMPAENHPIKSLENKRKKYLDGTVAYSSGSAPALGSVATIGFLALVGWLLVKQNRGRTQPDHVLDAMSIMNIAAILLATVGGFSAVANLLSVGVLRGYDRISIFIMFFALVPVAAWMSSMQTWASQRRWRQIYYACSLVLITGWGMFEQSRYCRMPGDSVIAEFHSDRSFVNQIASHAGTDGKIFQFPVQNFLSQSGPAIQWDPYTHFRGYAHSSSLTWSFGAVVGRAPAQIQNWIDSQSPEQSMKTLALMDFDGIYIDRKLYSDNGQKFEASVERVLNQKPVISGNGRLSYFSLKELSSQLASSRSTEELATMRYEAQHPLLVDWDSLDVEEVYPDSRFRWCQGKVARLSLHNFGDQDRYVQLNFAVATSQNSAAKLKIAGFGLAEELTIGPAPLPLERIVRVPPGIHYLELHTDARPLVTPVRNVTFRMCEFTHQVMTDAQVASRSDTIRR